MEWSPVNVPICVAPEARVTRFIRQRAFAPNAYFSKLIMKLALLAADAAILQVAESARSQGHQVFDASDGSALADAYLVGSSADERVIDELRHLIQAGMPALVAHPFSNSMLVYYELDMIRRETECSLVPFIPGAWHPAVDRMAELVEAGESSPIGSVEQVIFERSLGDRGKALVVEHFARDVAVLRRVRGDITRLGAMGSPDAASPYGNLGVQMVGPGATVARWSVGPIEDEPSARLTAIGTSGKAVLHMPCDTTRWRLEIRSAGGQREESFAYSAGSEALERLHQAISGHPVAPDWADAARCVELAETIERSLLKGRTIELHREDFSDVGTFKGFMTSLGCGLLIAALLLIFLALIVQKIAEKAGWVRLAAFLGFWPYLLLAIFAVFLLLQLVLKVTHPPVPERPADE